MGLTSSLLFPTFHLIGLPIVSCTSQQERVLEFTGFGLR